MNSPANSVVNPVAERLKEHGLFAGLPDDEFPQLAALAREENHPKGAVLFQQGEACAGFYMVHSGMVRLYKIAADGREHVIEVIRPGQSFAEAAVFADVPFPVHAETLENSRFLFFPKKPFLAFLEARPRCLFGMIASLSVRMHNLVVKVERLSLFDARQRVAGFFVDLTATSGNGRLDVSKKTMASQLGLTPETLSRTLASLQADGMVALDGRQFRVTDESALSALSKGQLTAS